MKEIEKWYAEKIGKTPEEFDAIDKHIETVIQTWEKEREQALSLDFVSSRLSELDNLKEWLDNLKTSEHYCGYELDFGMERDEIYDYIEERRGVILNDY